MKLGSLFDGIGGALLCAKRCGIEPIWASEIEPFPIKVTEYHFPEVKHLGDITKINGAEIEPVDIIVGGSPCQDLSVAGKRAGLAGERSGLFMEQIRIVKEMRSATNKPRYMVWENVPGAFSSNEGEDFRAVLEETARVADPTVSIPRSVTGWANAGSILGNDFSISWRTLDAQYWGVPQRRRRIYLVADFGGQSAPEILFECPCVSRDSAESGNEGQGTAEDAERSVGSASGVVSKGNGEAFLMYEKHMSLGCGGGQAGQGYPAVLVPGKGIDDAEPIVLNDQGGSIMDVSDKVATLRAEMHGNIPVVCYNGENITSPTNAQNPKTGDPCHTLGTDSKNYVVCLQGSMIGRADENGPQGDGINKNVSFTLNTIDRHAVCYGISAYESNAMKSNNPHSGVYEADTARTLDQNGGNPACNQGGIMIFEPRSQDGTPRVSTDNLCPTLNTAQGGQRQPCIATYSFQRSDELEESEVACTQSARQYKSATDLVSAAGQVRRLTPLECERLQGYPSLVEVNSEMTKDEFIAYCVASGQIIADAETGEIYSRKGPGGMLLQEPKLLKGSVVSGYRCYKLVSGGLRYMCRGHRVVWIANNGLIPEGYVIDHINNDKSDNRLCNLQLLTPNENSTKAKSDDLYLCGDDNPNTKLKSWQKDLLLFDYASKEYPLKILMEKYGISRSRIHQIVRQSDYTNIPGASDTARYKALGNSFAIPNAYFVISRIKEAIL